MALPEQVRDNDPVVTQGANPVHLYDFVSFETLDSGEICFLPGDAFATPERQITLGDYELMTTTAETRLPMPREMAAGT